MTGQRLSSHTSRIVTASMGDALEGRQRDLRPASVSRQAPVVPSARTVEVGAPHGRDAVAPDIRPSAHLRQGRHQKSCRVSLLHDDAQGACLASAPTAHCEAPKHLLPSEGHQLPWCAQVDRQTCNHTPPFATRRCVVDTDSLLLLLVLTLVTQGMSANTPTKQLHR